MRLEIIYPDAELQIYPILKDKIIIGSSETVDLRITVDGISRRHVCLLFENGRYYIADLNSLNGTYMNNERLSPGKKIEFNNSFPIMLSDSVLISILEDENTEVNEPQDFKKLEPLPAPSSPIEKSDLTRVISLKDLEKGRTTNLIQERDKLRSLSKTKVKVKNVTSGELDKSRMKRILIFVLILIGTSLSYQLLIKKNNSKNNLVSRVNPPVQEDSTVEKEINYIKISRDNFPSNDFFLSGFSQLKCTTELEKKLCSLFPEVKDSFSGFFESGGKIIALLPLNERYVDTIKVLPEKTPTRTTLNYHLTKSQRFNLMGLLFLKNIPTFQWKDIKQSEVYFVFYLIENNKPLIFSILGIPTGNIDNLKSQLTPDFFKNVKRKGPKFYKNFSQQFKMLFFK